MVRANAWDPERYRPMWLQNKQENQTDLAMYEEFKRRSRALFESGQAMEPEQAADILLQGIQEDKFYIRTHPGTKDDLVRARIDDLLQGKNPVDRIPAHREKMIK